jgi:hypothetical protein
MDGNRFDLLAKMLYATGTRRGVVGFLSTLPLCGGLAALLGAEETDAKGRRQRRKKRHKHGQGSGRRHRKGKRAGDKHAHCAKAGQKPKAGKPCCADLSETDAGRCVAPSPPPPCDASSCATGCCGGSGTCHIEDDAACGTEGGTCAPCTVGETCQQGMCVCPIDCAGKACGADDSCGGTCQTGDCPVVGQTCQNGVCEPTTGQSYFCRCNDGTTQLACRPIACDVTILYEICPPVCADRGGLQQIGTFCNNTPCTL